MYMNLKRSEIENAVEDAFVVFAEATIPASPGRDDLKRAHNYNPNYFGGRFPAMGVEVTSSSGQSRIPNKPGRPGRVRGTLYIYDVAMPVRGAKGRDEDRTSRAKKNARRIREEVFEKLFEDMEYRAATLVEETRSSIFNDMGFPMLDVAGSQILWVDRTDFEIRL